MPIPKPTSSERQQEYIRRCYMSIKDEYKPAQAFTICYNKWRESKK